jgi:hypothetical protein
VRPITLIFAYYENPKMLSVQYAHLKGLPVELKKWVNLVVVDDGSPQYSAWGEDLGLLSVMVCRMTKDIRWNQDACRNLAVSLSATKWILLTDIDHIVPVETLNCAVHSEELSERDSYQFTRVSLASPIDSPPWKLTPYKAHPNTWLITKNLYERVGGYDERFAGYYGTDGDFRTRVLSVSEVVHLPYPIIRVPREIVADASTTHYKRKTPEDGANIKRIKQERAFDPEWRPKRLTFPWELVGEWR